LISKVKRAKAARLSADETRIFSDSRQTIHRNDLKLPARASKSPKENSEPVRATPKSLARAFLYKRETLIALISPRAPRRAVTRVVRLRQIAELQFIGGGGIAINAGAWAVISTRRINGGRINHHKISPYHPRRRYRCVIRNVNIARRVPHSARP